jgi:hypothetical protein
MRGFLFERAILYEQFAFPAKKNSFERRTQSIHCNARQSDGRIKTNTESPKTEQRGHIQFSGSFVEGTLGETRKSRSRQKKMIWKSKKQARSRSLGRQGVSQESLNIVITHRIHV